MYVCMYSLNPPNFKLILIFVSVIFSRKNTLTKAEARGEDQNVWAFFQLSIDRYDLCVCI